jgi:ribosomal protein S18 acetylase RimI-like enzyme
MNSNVRTATSADELPVIQTVVAAFSADPVARWSWPQAHEYLTAMARFTVAFGGGAFANQSAHFTEGYSGAALWLPPGEAPDDEELMKIIEETVPASIRGDLNGVFEQMANYHPKEPHWYLPLIGVDPPHQGKGHGAALLSHALKQCDLDQVPAYLESTNPRNVTLYQRHGFRELGVIQVGTSPPLIPMLRTPRTS